MKKEKKNRLVYTWFWIWLLIVTTASVYIYLEIFDSAVAVVSEFSILFNAYKAKGDSWVTVSLKLVGGVLFCWRAVKVFVLHGAPLSFGMQVRAGRENNVAGGRLVTAVSIGDDVFSQNLSGEFWFGAIFRAHPTSDKLMRTRLEMLTAALPFGRSLLISESRINLVSHGHSDRTSYFEFRVKKYDELPNTNNSS